MMLVFKNKFLMALDALIKDGEGKGGIPKHITLDAEECSQFIQEIHYLSGGEYKFAEHVDIQSSKPLVNLEDNLHPAYLIKQIGDKKKQEELTLQTIDYILKFWKSGDIIITYKKVPLVPDTRKKPDKTEWVSMG